MRKLLILIVFGVITKVNCKNSDEMPKLENARQKKLLFYDEEGNLVKTYSNPADYFQNADKFPGIGFMNPFLAFLRPPGFGNLPTPYMIPVSDEASQAITDPLYQNKVFFLPSREQNILPNPLCQGKRIQIPSSRCSSFLNCWDGWAYEQECPPGLMFSSMGYCDYPDKVNCFDRRIANVASPGSQSQSQSDSQSQPKCDKEFEAFRSELSCSEFFVCVSRSPVRFKCPADLAFNQELGICDYSTRVNCKGSLGGSAEAPPQPVKAPPPAAPAAPELPAGLQSLVMRNSVFNSQSFSSSHVAMSRQDAIRQLELKRLAKVSTD